MLASVIAHGHHRQVALRKLRIPEIDIPNNNMDDRTILKTMADEKTQRNTRYPPRLSTKPS
jgi:hypothetical protein